MMGGVLSAVDVDENSIDGCQLGVNFCSSVALAPDRGERGVPPCTHLLRYSQTPGYVVSLFWDGVSPPARGS